MSDYLAGILTGIGVSVMANFLYAISATSIGNRLIRHRINFSSKGHWYPNIDIDVCGSVSVSNSKWGWFIKKVYIPLSVRLTFKSRDGKQIKTLARWKIDMDESTVTMVRLESIKEVILVTLHGGQVFPGSEVVGFQPLQGDWDLDLEIIDGDTQHRYLLEQIKGIVIDSKLTITEEQDA